MRSKSDFTLLSIALFIVVVCLTMVVTPEAAAQTGLKFNGTNQYVTFGTAPSLGTKKFTLELWFRRDGTGVTTSTGNGGLTSIVPLLTKGRGRLRALLTST